MTTPQAPADPREKYIKTLDNPEYNQLRKTFRSFAFPVSAAFLLWYLLYIVLAMYAPSFMEATVAGNVNVALLMGWLQFLSTGIITWAYVSYMKNKVDPLADKIRDELNAEGK